MTLDHTEVGSVQVVQFCDNLCGQGSHQASPALELAAAHPLQVQVAARGILCEHPQKAPAL